MKRNFGFGIIAVLMYSIVLAISSSAEVDRAALFKHLPKALPFPPGVEFNLKGELQPSGIPGFLTGTLVGHYKGHTQEWPIQVSEDGHYYIVSGIYTLTPSKVPGLLAPSDPSGPQVFVSKDAKHFVLGEVQDMRSDPDKITMSKINLKGAAFRGSSTSPVALVEYSDLECPFCRAAHQILEKELLPSYRDKVRWYFKHNPLVTVHPWAYNAAIAAACAAKMKPEAGWELESDFFKAQPDASIPFNDQQAAEQKIVGNIRAMSIEFAEKAGLNKDRFTTCYDKQESKTTVEADRKEAEALHLDSTPAFIVNGRIVRGFREFATLKDVIDAMFAETGKAK